jgi:hypothetical protein
VHVDEENRLELVPHNLDCFEKLAQAGGSARAEVQVAGALAIEQVPRAACAVAEDAGERHETRLLDGRERGAAN